MEFPEILVKESDIAVKELWTILQAVKQYAGQEVELVIAVDSTVARSQIQKRLCIITGYQHILRELSDQTGVTFWTIFVYSEDNIADPPRERVPKNLSAVADLTRHRKFLYGTHVYAFNNSDGKCCNHKLPLENLSGLRQEMVSQGILVDEMDREAYGHLADGLADSEDGDAPINVLEKEVDLKTKSGAACRNRKRGRE